MSSDFSATGKPLEGAHGLTPRVSVAHDFPTLNPAERQVVDNKLSHGLTEVPFGMRTFGEDDAGSEEDGQTIFGLASINPELADASPEGWEDEEDAVQEKSSQPSPSQPSVRGVETAPSYDEVEEIFPEDETAVSKEQPAGSQLTEKELHKLDKKLAQYEAEVKRMSVGGAYKNTDVKDLPDRLQELIKDIKEIRGGASLTSDKLAVMKDNIAMLKSEHPELRSFGDKAKSFFSSATRELSNIGPIIRGSAAAVGAGAKCFASTIGREIEKGVFTTRTSSALSSTVTLFQSSVAIPAHISTLELLKDNLSKIDRSNTDESKNLRFLNVFMCNILNTCARYPERVSKETQMLIDELKQKLVESGVDVAKDFSRTPAPEIEKALKLNSSVLSSVLKSGVLDRLQASVESDLSSRCENLASDLQVMANNIAGLAENNDKSLFLELDINQLVPMFLRGNREFGTLENVESQDLGKAAKDFTQSVTALVRNDSFIDSCVDRMNIMKGKFDEMKQMDAGPLKDQKLFDLLKEANALLVLFAAIDNLIESRDMQYKTSADALAKDIIDFCKQFSSDTVIQEAIKKGAPFYPEGQLNKAGGALEQYLKQKLI